VLEEPRAEEEDDDDEEGDGDDARLGRPPPKAPPRSGDRRGDGEGDGAPFCTGVLARSALACCCCCCCAAAAAAHPIPSSVVDGCLECVGGVAPGCSTVPPGDGAGTEAAGTRLPSPDAMLFVRDRKPMPSVIGRPPGVSVPEGVVDPEAPLPPPAPPPPPPPPASGMSTPLDTVRGRNWGAVIAPPDMPMPKEGSGLNTLTRRRSSAPGDPTAGCCAAVEVTELGGSGDIEAPKAKEARTSTLRLLAARGLLLFPIGDASADPPAGTWRPSKG